jgi:glycosyltransferase involved in cell wall biosynthesis
MFLVTPYHVPTMAAMQSEAGRTHVTVCLPTRNRGANITATLESLARLDHPDFDVVVVDQSTDTLTRRAYDVTVGSDPRFSYRATDTVGLSVALNTAVAMATGSIIAKTDDDCEVPPDWLTGIERHFADHPTAAMICGGVSAGEHDKTAGSIPAFIPARVELFTSPWRKYRARGIGANIAFRAAALQSVGRFDEVLGAGGPLKSCEDGDMAYRMLRCGFGVLDVPEPSVVHNGFRTWSQGRALGRDALMSCGATCMKHLRLWDMAIVPTLIFLWFRRTINWSNLIRLRRPNGIALFYEFGRGMYLSFRFSIDGRTRTYVPRGREGVPTQPSPITPVTPSARLS